MIRPFTLLCFLLACGSGLYLYQSKHRVQMLDREIERTVHATEATRDQVRLLGAEWMLLNDPERLRALADQFLSLRTVTPAQFTTLADLDRRLPPVRSPDAPLEPVPEPEVMTPMIPLAGGQAPAQATPAAPAAAPQVQAPAHAAPAVMADRKPPPEKPVAPPAAHVAAAQTDPHPASVPHNPQIASATPRPAMAYKAPIAPVAATLPGGSVLGMAAGSSLPPPKPISLFQPIDH